MAKTARKRAEASSRKSKKNDTSPKRSLRSKLGAPRRWLRDLKSRRPHRSFRLTRRRDYRRALNLPGYIAFTHQTFQLLWKNRKVFIALVVTFAFLTVLLGGLSAQSTYDTIGETFDQAESPVDTVTRIGTLGLVLLSATPTSEVQQLYVGFMIVLVWLTTVWLLRELMAGKTPKFRDGLYSAGAPLMASVVLVLVLLVQLIPAGLVALAYSALAQIGLIDQGLGAMLFFLVAALILALTLFWITTTFLALVIVTLPGMYPWRAMRSAADIVIGRRLRVLYRLLWMVLTVAVLWAVTVIPTIALDQWLRSVFEWWTNIPLVSIVAVTVTTVTTLWVSAYIYHLYRKIVAHDASE